MTHDEEAVTNDTLPHRRPLSVTLTRLRVLTWKEFLQLYRDRILLVFMLYAFTVDIYLAGSGISLNLREATTVVHDADHSYASRELYHRFQPPYFNLDTEILDGRTGTQLLDRNEAIVALDIPEGFEKSLMRGEPTEVQMQVDASNSVIGFLASSYGQRIVGQYGLDVAFEQAGLDPANLDTVPRIIDQHRVWYNPNQEDTWFMSIAQLLNIVTLFSIMLPASAMAREKERGTVEQLLVSPLTPLEIMMPKVLAMTGVILVGTMLSLFLILQGCFGVPIRGSLPLFFVITALYVFTTAGLGILVATVANNLAQVGMLTALIICPMIFLSGAWTPPEAMSPFMRSLMLLSPLHYYIDASFQVLLKGVGLELVWDSLLGMAVLGTLVFGFSVWRFRKQFG